MGRIPRLAACMIPQTRHSRLNQLLLRAVQSRFAALEAPKSADLLEVPFLEEKRQVSKFADYGKQSYLVTPKTAAHSMPKERSKKQQSASIDDLAYDKIS